MKHFIFAILMGILLSSCSLMDIKAKKLQEGMTKEEVSDLMGQPNDRSFKNNIEAWQYYGYIGHDQCTYVTVWYEDGVVKALTTRRDAYRDGCQYGLREIDWSQIQ